MAKVLRKRGEVTRNFPRRTEFVQRVRACLALARAAYPEFTLQDKDLPIVFYKNGRAAGMAKWLDKGNEVIYNIEFSVEAINNEWDDMVKNTIPHEVAHIVDRFINGKCNKHNYIWQSICQRLGGSASSTHSYAVTRARKMTKILYTASCGTEVWVTKRMHNDIQRKNQVRILSSTRGRITSQHCNWVEKKV